MYRVVSLNIAVAALHEQNHSIPVVAIQSGDIDASKGLPICDALEMDCVAGVVRLELRNLSGHKSV